MFNDPKVDETITLQGKSYQFIQVPGAQGIVYAELGKKAKVYRVVRGSKAYALKVFKPAYRTPQLLKNTAHILAQQEVPGLSVAERTIITPEKFPNVIQVHPEFTYAILMPWIEGKSWANYVISKTATTRNESIRLAKAFAQAICELEKRNIAHCDLSGGNFIFSTAFNDVEFVDIEELYGPDFPRPDILPAGTSGYSPDWVKEKGLWGANADRFAAGILICEILAWQFDDIRVATSGGDAFFAEGELGHASTRYKLLEKRLAEIHPELAVLFRTVWRGKDASECPRISEWKTALDQVASTSSEPNWGWESLDLPPEIDQAGNTNQERSRTAGQDSDIPIKRPFQEESGTKHESEDIVVTANEWPASGKSRKDLLIRIFSIFALVGTILFLLILVFGNFIDQISRIFREQSGLLLGYMVTNSILGLLVGSVHAWIFRNNIRASHVWLFISAAFLGGAIGGVITGFLTNLGYVTTSYMAGAIIGSIGGSLSSLGQNLFMRSQGQQIKWFLFSLLSWFVIWIIGTTISWTNQTVPGMAGTAALIILLSGVALSVFLHAYPEVEF